MGAWQLLLLTASSGAGIALLVMINRDRAARRGLKARKGRRIDAE